MGFHVSLGECRMLMMVRLRLSFLAHVAPSDRTPAKPQLPGSPIHNKYEHHIELAVGYRDCLDVE